jgi:hypothetical protein
MIEKSLAMVDDMFNARVMTGKATAPPPSEVAPAIMAPKTIVTESKYRLEKYWKKSCLIARLHQIWKTKV